SSFALGPSVRASSHRKTFSHLGHTTSSPRTCGRPKNLSAEQRGQRRTMRDLLLSQARRGRTRADLAQASKSLPLGDLLDSRWPESFPAQLPRLPCGNLRRNPYLIWATNCRVPLLFGGEELKGFCKLQR